MNQRRFVFFFRYTLVEGRMCLSTHIYDAELQKESKGEGRSFKEVTSLGVKFACMQQRMHVELFHLPLPLPSLFPPSSPPLTFFSFLCRVFSNLQ